MNRLLRSMKAAPWSAIVCAVFAYATVHEVERLRFWERGRVLNWDIEGYYHYLPALFIHGDVRDLSYVTALDEQLHADDPAQRRSGIHRMTSTGHDLIKYSCGTALFELPLFLVAHAYCIGPGAAPADGYSWPYQLAVALSAALFAVFGLLVLRRLVLRYFVDRAAAFALMAIGLGTNLFFYATVDAGLSHAYVFFLFALIAERTDQWHRTPRSRDAAVIGLAVGLAVLTRPVDGMVVLVPLLWGIGSRAGLRAKSDLLRRYGGQLLLAACCGLLAVLPQLAYWKAVTGHWIYFSYIGERFDLAHPHVLEGLFSYRKGWFVYTPLAAVGVASLLLMLRDGRWRGYAVPVIAYFLVATYVIFSWEQWWYGGSFGCRPLVPMLALLALPMASLAQHAWARGTGMAALLGAVILGGVHLNLFQQEQYRHGILHWDSMTRERYWEVFGKDTWKDLAPFP